MTYPYSRPWITADDIASVTGVFAGQFLTQGDNLQLLERELAEELGSLEAVVCNSGTAALHLAYSALDLGPDRGLVTSPITFLATASAARMCDAPVAFADVDPETGNMTPETADTALALAPFPVAALVPVHLGGRPCDMEGLRAVAEAHGVAIVEDACHAPGARYGASGEFQVGACAHSTAATFSFHAIKQVAMGEGGALLTNDTAIAARARLLRNHGMTRNEAQWVHPPEPDAPWYYEMHELGWNYRATELQCALGRSQLRRLQEGLERRRELVEIYQSCLGNLQSLKLPARPDRADGHAWHLFALALDFEAIGVSRGQVMRALAERGVGTQVHYIPLYHQPYYARATPTTSGGAERYYAQTLSLPLYVGLEPEDVGRIGEAVLEVVGGEA